MAEHPNAYLNLCLYFTANSLARSITRMADEAFAGLRMSPAHAFMLMLVVEQPGITQKELATHLHLAQSTVSRFADKLVQLKHVTKQINGKLVQVYPTALGKIQLPIISHAWKSLFERYSSVLGKEYGEELTRQSFEAYRKIDASLAGN